LDQSLETFRSRTHSEEKIRKILKHNCTRFIFNFSDHVEEAALFCSAYETIYDPGFSKPKEELAVKNEIFHENLLLIAREVTQELEKQTHVLNKTDSFVMLYSDDDDLYFYSEEYRKRYEEIWADWIPASCFSL
jgi:hypothetical protein